MTTRKLFSRHNRAVAPTNSQQLLQHAQEVCRLKPDQTQPGGGRGA